jgi:hypothetical protein
MAIADFLLARIAEREDSALRWHDGECDYLAVNSAADLMMGAQVPGAFCDCGGPGRVLSDCDAQRRIVEAISEAATDLRMVEPEHGDTLRRLSDSLATERQWYLRLLALPYSDHPDFDEAWRP